MTPEQIAQAAERLDDAAKNAAAVDMLTISSPGLSVEDGYRIQRASVARRLGRGETLVGMKMGLTSRAKMEQVGVFEPIYGHLTDAMRCENNGSIARSAHIHPRVEPEIAFVISRDIDRPITANEALGYIDGVTSALEIIDSRYKDFQFALPDVVADNASSARFVLGETLTRPHRLNISQITMLMTINGAVMGQGMSDAILGNPFESLVALVAALAEQGECVKAGQIVLAGATTAAVHVKSGDHICLDAEGLGVTEFSVA
jgi:2-oxo-3-hexenedioate decarboxylase